jgi:hypothetical protein
MTHHGFRLGRHQNRTLYRQWGTEPSEGDELLGIVFPPAVARLAVDALNMFISHDDGTPSPAEGPYHSHGCHNLHCGQLQIGCLLTPAATRLLVAALNWYYYHGEPE